MCVFCLQPQTLLRIRLNRWNNGNREWYCLLIWFTIYIHVWRCSHSVCHTPDIYLYVYATFSYADYCLHCISIFCGSVRQYKTLTNISNHFGVFWNVQRLSCSITGRDNSSGCWALISNIINNIQVFYSAFYSVKQRKNIPGIRAADGSLNKVNKGNIADPNFNEMRSSRTKQK